MARKAKQQVSFKVSFTLPPDMTVKEAREWVEAALKQSGGQNEPKVEPDTIRVKLDSRHVYY